MLDADACYKAMLARDPRFDGTFYVGVRTTGIYCRPICPAKPKRENVVFFASRRAAETAGFRPCLRCRPEAAPHSPAWHGTSATVQRALKLIAAGVRIEDDGEDAFAARLGTGARHLRRLFRDELGATPKQISDANRLSFASLLLTETNLPVSSIAGAAGFASLRRFNDAFKKRFSRTPSQLRSRRPATKKRPVSGGTHDLSLGYRPPFDWTALLRYFEYHRAPGGAEEIEGEVYRRTFRIGGSVGAFEVAPLPGKHRLRLRAWTDDPRILFEIVRRARSMFDLDSDPVRTANAFAASPLLARLVEHRPGLRVPRGWDPFEAAVCTILGQLVSGAQARSLIGQLVEAYGERVARPGDGLTVTLFPRPEALADATLSEVRTTGGRKEAIREFARRVVDGRIHFSSEQDLAEFKKSVLAVKGLGPWTAEYASLRAMGDSDAFPGADLILKRVLDANPLLDLEPVRPWRAYAALHLWEDFDAANREAAERKKNDPGLP